jgi:hypothetical protein
VVSDSDGELIARAHPVTVRDGRIVHLDGYDEPNAALAAAALER